MDAAVDQVLARRQQLAEEARGRRPLIGALVLHATVVALALLLPHLSGKAPKEPLRFVSVQVIPQAALGSEQPPPPPPPEPAPKPEITPPPPPPEPEVKPELPPPPPPPTQPEQPVLPAPRVKPPPPPPPAAPPPTKPATTEPVSVAPTRQGSESGSRRGSASFGTAVASVDNPDFTYAYYVDRMTALIRSHWRRPGTPDGAAATLRFRIATNGTVSSLEVIETSGLPIFDRAAMRAVEDASPLPPLPVGYRHDSLGVTLIVR